MPSSVSPYEWVGISSYDVPASEPTTVSISDLNVVGGGVIIDEDLPDEEHAVQRTVKKDWSFDETKLHQMISIGKPHQLSTKFADQFLEHNKYLWPEQRYVFKYPKILVGLEVEIENILSIDPGLQLCFWQVDQDGSLRNNGREFRSSALPIGFVEPALRQLFFGLNHNIEFTKRCSVHVHIDVRQLTPSQIMGFLVTYTAVENLLFQFAELSRRSNIFCVPITETYLLRTMNSKDPKEWFQNLRDKWEKYTALNISNLSKFGTFEFRHMPGTSNIRKLCIWIDLISRMRTFSYKNSLTEIITTISELNTSSRYRQFVESVFEELTVHLDTSALLQQMEKPVYIVKNMAMFNNFHQQILSSGSAIPESDLYQLCVPKKNSKSIKEYEFLSAQEVDALIRIQLRLSGTPNIIANIGFNPSTAKLEFIYYWIMDPSNRALAMAFGGKWALFLINGSPNPFKEAA